MIIFMKDLRDESVYQKAVLQGVILICLCLINLYFALIFLILMFSIQLDYKKRFKKTLLRLENFKFNEKFKKMAIFINHKTNRFDYKNDFLSLGPCFIQALELYKQMLEKDFKQEGFFIHLKEFSYLNEDFKEKNIFLIQKYQYKMQNLKNAFFKDRKDFIEARALIDCDFFKKLFKMDFDFEYFENISQLRAFLSKQEFLNLAFFCQILGTQTNHINLIYKDKKGLLCINTAQANFKSPFENITEQTSDKKAFEIIAKNYLNDPDDAVQGFILYYPFVLKEDLYKAYKIIYNLK